MGYIAPNTPDDGEKFVKHIAGYGSGDVTIEVIDPFAIRDSINYQIVFSSIDDDEDNLGYSIRNQDQVIETLSISDDSTAIASFNKLDNRMVLNETILEDTCNN